MTTRELAVYLVNDQQLALIYQALLVIDATALPEAAILPVVNGQKALTTIRNITQGVARRGGKNEQADRLTGALADLKSSYEAFRGILPPEP